MMRIKPQEIDPSALAMAAGGALVLFIVLLVVVALFSLERVS